MCHTQEGDRVLTGNEAKLFLASLRFMVDIMEDNDLEDTWAFRVEVFDRAIASPSGAALRAGYFPATPHGLQCGKPAFVRFGKRWRLVGRLRFVINTVSLVRRIGHC
jgi:hypothetical protein